MTKSEYRRWVKRHNHACALVNYHANVTGKLTELQAKVYYDELILYGRLLTPERTEAIIKELEIL